jgi:cyclopropane fatty-acyl-phospholipid synthase-like methyltransferase
MESGVKKENWEQFWSARGTHRFTQKSWSKVRMMEVLDDVVREGMEVLDAGCGSGFFSAYFLEKGCRVWALDHSETSLEIARKSTQGRCQAYLKEDLFRDDWEVSFRGKFDLIFSDGLFEHFTPEDQRRLIDRFRMLKKEDGLIATFVPNRYSWWEIVRPLVMPGIQEVPFTVSDLKELHSGMRLLKTGGLNVLPFRVSPERSLGSSLGMLLYVLAS